MVLLNQQSNKSIFVSGAMSRKADNKKRLGTFGTARTWDMGHPALPGPWSRYKCSLFVLSNAVKICWQ